MKKRLTLSLVISLSTALAMTPLQLQAKSKQPCAKYDRKIDAIKQKMRHGYTIKKGEYYKQKLVELQDDRVVCEKKAKRNKNKKR